MSSARSPRYTIAHNIVVRLVSYYAALAALAVGGWALLPMGARAAIREGLAPLLSAGVGGPVSTDLFGSQASRTVVGASPPIVVGAAVLVAFLLALPVAWTYMWTRRTKGYSQSVVHSLILLPVVVAGVVVLVKSSLALAFSLAGIVAAVRFRNTLDDSKDAVFIFFATALGLAAAVQVDAAAVMSVMFIAIVLTLWYSDFARMPPGLEDARAERQLERAVAEANRTSEFVARVDRELLQAMAPAQLDALADRVRRRRSESEDFTVPGLDAREASLRIVVSDEVDGRATVEPIIARHCKRWQPLVQRANGAGRATLEYAVTLRKRYSPTELAAAVEREGRPLVITAEVLETIGS